MPDTSIAPDLYHGVHKDCDSHQYRCPQPIVRLHQLERSRLSAQRVQQREPAPDKDVRMDDRHVSHARGFCGIEQKLTGTSDNLVPPNAETNDTTRR
jgi:hypothetical protein